jgi:hypothetical protein
MIFCSKLKISPASSLQLFPGTQPFNMIGDHHFDLIRRLAINRPHSIAGIFSINLLDDELLDSQFVGFER